MGRNGVPKLPIRRPPPAEQCHAYAKSLRGLAGCKESWRQQWSRTASTGLARQEVDDSQEVASLKNMDTVPGGAARAPQHLFADGAAVPKARERASAHSLSRPPPTRHARRRRTKSD